MSTFKVGITRDFLTPDGDLVYKDIGLGLLDAEPGIEHFFLPRHEPTLTPDLLENCDALISLTPKYTADSFVGLTQLQAVLRFGVGYDMVDVGACTASSVLLCITAGAVNHPVAEAIVTWMLALSHRVMDKDKLVRESRWGERGQYMGRELRDRVLGTVGLGGIGKTLAAMVQAFGMASILAYDPVVTPEQALNLGVELVSLQELMQRSDFVAVNCPLTDQTRDLIGSDLLSQMRPDAYLINTARGGIVNEAALIQILQAGKIAGAGIDVFAEEPAGGDHPLAALDNVILAPHCIAWTDELFRDIGASAARAAIALSRGETPGGVINPSVLSSAGFRSKQRRSIS